MKKYYITKRDLSKKTKTDLQRAGINWICVFYKTPSSQRGYYHSLVIMDRETEGKKKTIKICDTDYPCIATADEDLAMLLKLKYDIVVYQYKDLPNR